VFGAPAGDAGAIDGVTADDWAARYMAWMGLGGTTKLIPSSILGIVANTQVLGVRRTSANTNSANMLSNAQYLCSALLAGKYFGTTLSVPKPIRTPSPTFDDLALAPLMHENGDAELWARLCTVNNPIPIAGIQIHVDESSTSPFVAGFFDGTNGRYPAGVPVGTDHGTIAEQLVTDGTNLTPWCIVKPDLTEIGADRIQAAYAYLDQHRIDGKALPICPSQLFATQNPAVDRMLDSAME
jgi:hypothetical protein